jgi:hypothetical protein
VHRPGQHPVENVGLELLKLDQTAKDRQQIEEFCGPFCGPLRNVHLVEQ